MSYALILAIVGNTQDRGIMLAHYFMFFGSFKKCILFIIEGVFDKWTDRINHIDYGIHEEGFRIQLIMKSILQLQLPLGSWLLIKYQYYFPFSLLTGSIISMLGPLAYFHSLLRAHGEFSFTVLCVQGGSFTHSLTDKTDYSILRHWHDTLLIFNTLGIQMQIMYGVAAAILQDQDATLILAAFFISITSLFVWCKDYLKTYVQIDKI